VLSGREHDAGDFDAGFLQHSSQLRVLIYIEPKRDAAVTGIFARCETFLGDLASPAGFEPALSP
jgi:predicted nucleic acid-binding Zn finger protein